MTAAKTKRYQDAVYEAICVDVSSARRRSTSALFPTHITLTPADSANNHFRAGLPADIFFRRKSVHAEYLAVCQSA